MIQSTERSKGTLVPQRSEGCYSNSNGHDMSNAKANENNETMRVQAKYQGR